MYHNTADYSNNTDFGITNIESDASKNDLLIQSISSNIYFITDPCYSVIFQSKLKVKSDAVFTNNVLFKENIDISKSLKVHDISLLNNIILNTDVSYNIKNDVLIDGNAYVSKESGSQLKIKLVDMSDLDISINTSKNEIINTISNEYYKNNIVYSKIEIDNSFVLTSSFEDLETQFLNFDSSYAKSEEFLELNNNFYVLDNSFITYVNKTDNSFSNLINYLNVSFVTDVSFAVLQTQVNTIDTSLIIVDTSFTSLQRQINIIDASFQNLQLQITEIDNSLNNFYTKTEIDASLISLASASSSSSEWSKTGSDIYYNSGNVGIGTNSPSQKLQVSGDALINGKLNLGDSGNFIHFGEIVGSNNARNLLA